MVHLVVKSLNVLWSVTVSQALHCILWPWDSWGVLINFVPSTFQFESGWYFSLWCWGSYVWEKHTYAVCPLKSILSASTWFCPIFPGDSHLITVYLVMPVSCWVLHCEDSVSIFIENKYLFGTKYFQNIQSSYQYLKYICLFVQI